MAAPSSAAAALPDPAWTAAAHARIATAPRVLGSDRRATVSAIADAIIPRTDTPGALDVGAPDFIELLLAEWVTEADRSAFDTGLAELDARVQQQYGKPWPALDAQAAANEIAWAETAGAEPTAGQRTLRRIKSWTVHAWITSERIQRTVIRYNITPGRYEGCVPRANAGGGR